MSLGRRAPDPIFDLQARLEAAATPGKKVWWERYLRGTASFRGTPMAEVRRSVHDWYGHHRLEAWAGPTRLDLALRLLREPLSEDRLACMLLLQEILLPAGQLEWEAALPAFARVFDEGSLADWNSCDWFCVKVLGPMVERWGRPCAEAVVGWKDAPGLWRRLPSGVVAHGLGHRPLRREGSSPGTLP